MTDQRLEAGPETSAPEAGLDRRRRYVRLAWFAVAVCGALFGAAVLVFYLVREPLSDVRAYYDAGARLNSGLPLYPADADPNEAEFYRYPPLLAIAFRPAAAFLPYETAALLWGALCLATFAGTLVVLGLHRPRTWVAAGILGFSIGYALAIGQAQTPVTLLVALGSPWTVALAANIKVFPGLVALFWVGRREWRQLGLFAAWMAGLIALQFALEPQATVDFVRSLTLEQVGQVRNLSPYVISPILWAVLVLIGIALTLRLAPTKWGWTAAVALSTLATPRLLSYMFMTLLAALRPPAHPASLDPEGGGSTTPQDRGGGRAADPR